MGRRAAAGFLVVLALLSSVLASPAGAEGIEAPPRIDGHGPGIDPSVRTPHPLDALDALPRLDRLTDEWRRAQELDLEEFSYATSVHDLSGDGLDDVAIGHFLLRTDPSSDSGVRTVMRLELVDGRDGSRLWSRRWEKDGYAAVFPVDAKTGRAATNGLWLVTYQDATGLVAINSFSVHYEIEAVDARGRKLWAQEFDTTYVFTHFGYSINGLVSLDIFDGAGRRQSDVLIGTGTHVDTGFASVSAIKAQVAEGATGAISDHGLPLHSVNFLPYPRAVDDLTEDGKDDYLMMMAGPYTGEDQEDTPFVTIDGVVIARLGKDGTTIWETPLDLGRYAWVSGNEQVTASDTDDLVITMWDFSIVQIADLPVGFITRVETVIYLLEGSTGDHVWSKPGEDAFVPGDIDGDSKAEVITLSTVDGDDYIGTKLRAFTYSGDLVYKKTHRFTSLTKRVSLFYWWWWTLAGDVHPDRLTDLFISHEVDGAPGVGDGEGLVIDSSDGEVQARFDPRVWPLGGPLGGNGDDLFRTCWRAPGTISVIAFAGDSGSVLWGRSIQFVVPVAHRQADAWGESLDVTRGPGSDLLVTVNVLKGGYVVAIDGRSGNPIWIRQIHGLGNEMSVAPLDDPNCD